VHYHRGLAIPAIVSVPLISLLDDRTRVALHRRWQALRRNTDYRHAVKTCIEEIETLHATTIAQLDAFVQASEGAAMEAPAATMHQSRPLVAQRVAVQQWLCELAALGHTLRAGIFGRGGAISAPMAIQTAGAGVNWGV
jgi:hypothetical protein